MGHCAQATTGLPREKERKRARDGLLDTQVELSACNYATSCQARFAPSLFLSSSTSTATFTSTFAPFLQSRLPPQSLELALGTSDGSAQFDLELFTNVRVSIEFRFRHFSLSHCLLLFLLLAEANLVHQIL